MFYVAKKCTNTDIFCRLSSFASKQLLAGNPNMADLSDKNRPTKIGEKFGLLFDEEWSEAFESFNEKLRFPEEECLRVLSKILRVRTSYLFFWQNYYTYKIFGNLKSWNCGKNYKTLIISLHYFNDLWYRIIRYISIRYHCWKTSDQIYVNPEINI